jgi:hypothetical protein
MGDEPDYQGVCENCGKPFGDTDTGDDRPNYGYFDDAVVCQACAVAFEAEAK